MEDILTSIRTSVEEETAKVASGEVGGADEVLALSDDDIVDAAAEEGLIDIDAFANSGEQKPAANVATGGDVLGVNAPGPVAPAKVEAPVAAPAAGAPADEVKAAEDEFDRLLAELETPEAEAAAAAQPVVAPVAAAAPVVAAPVAAAPAAPTVAVDEVVPEVPAAPAPVVAAPVAKPVVAAPAAVGGRLELAAIETIDGLQVAFPAEILAAALRPLVKDWVAENLPAVVERLVKDEIAKISQE